MMELSKDELYQDVTVIGQNGLLKSNSFLLATVFPVFKTLFTSSAQNDEPIVISMPDMNVIQMKTFLKNLSQPQKNFSVGINILQLLQSTPFKYEVNDMEEKEIKETEISIKVEESSIDFFSMLDPEPNPVANEISSNNTDSKPLVLGIMKMNKKDLVTDNGRSSRKVLKERPPATSKCEVCDREFACRKKFSNHMRSHKLVPCPHCSLGINSNNLTRHMSSCEVKKEQNSIDKETDQDTPSKGFKKKRKCVECGKIVYKLSNLIIHLKNEHNIKAVTRNEHIKGSVIHKCDTCDVMNKDVYAIKRHVAKHHHSREVQDTQGPFDMNNLQSYFKGRRKNDYLNIENFNERAEVVGEETPVFNCKICGYAQKSFNLFHRHFRWKHSEVAEKVPCHFCGKTFHTWSLGYHMNQKHFTKEGHTKCIKCYTDIPTENFQSHDCEVKMFSCEKCGKCFKSKSALRNHNKHTHEFPEGEVCKICGINVKKINSHMKTHEERKPCPECNKLVKDLQKHIHDVHTSDKDKNLQCPDCGKGFLDKRKLENHKMSVHLKQRPYQCRYGCDFAYNDRCNRNAHERKKHGKLFTT